MKLPYIRFFKDVLLVIQTYYIIRFIVKMIMNDKQANILNMFREYTQHLISHNYTSDNKFRNETIVKNITE